MSSPNMALKDHQIKFLKVIMFGYCIHLSRLKTKYLKSIKKSAIRPAGKAKLPQIDNTKRSKTIPCPAAHPCTGHVRENPKSTIYTNLRQFSNITSGIYAKYHEWYLCQISRANHAIICLYYYPQKVCNFHM